MKIKICGLTREEDARLAVDLGAWALGFIFYAKSPRAVTVSRVAQMLQVLPKGDALRVGVFVNPSLFELAETVKGGGITTIQLHGDESAAFCQEVKATFPSLQIIKARRLEEPSFLDLVDFELIDHATADAWGGTGISVDWNLAANQKHDKIILAGGLNPLNINQAIQVVQPMAVDVSSGVEEAPGIKSHEKLRAFFEAVRRSS